MSDDNLFRYAGLSHGGNVLAMAKKYQRPAEQWLDLSTGLNPKGWSVPAVPEHIWQALPQEEDELQNAACEYYGCEYCLPVAGSQAAIKTLPELRNRSKVGIVSPTYAEHENAWVKAGHHVSQIKLNNIENELAALDVLVVINPNNPTGDMIATATLLSWHQQLSKKGGWLIVDEAFMDVTPQHSLLSKGILPGLIVLRSLGKFFGLAGLRCGFVITHEDLLQRLADKIGPWTVTGPTRYVAIRALKDKTWQSYTRDRLLVEGEKLSQLLNTYGLKTTGTALFQWTTHVESKTVFEIFAQQGILLRYFEESVIMERSLRFGLPENESQWQRLTTALILLENKLNINESKELPEHE
ncbi:MAG: threonine-phosphate decarboxylase CobD [Gammaproteobacteria bacterium]|nr:threonine-phosphate decarboxylase CobD [Gammaproteobacteria bacterium]